MLISRWFARRGEIDDRALAWLLGGEALLEIRVLARRARLQPDTCPPGEALEQINELADFSRDMLNLSQRRRHRPSRGHRSRREQAMRERPMAYRWAVTGPERRAWVLQRLERYGLRWTPPPPLPTPRKGLPTPTWRQRLGVVAGWPVRTPHGRSRLPRLRQLALIRRILLVERDLGLWRRGRSTEPILFLR